MAPPSTPHATLDPKPCPLGAVDFCLLLPFPSLIPKLLIHFDYANLLVLLAQVASLGWWLLSCSLSSSLSWSGLVCRPCSVCTLPSASFLTYVYNKNRPHNLGVITYSSFYFIFYIRLSGLVSLKILGKNLFP